MYRSACLPACLLAWLADLSITLVSAALVSLTLCLFVALAKDCEVYKGQDNPDEPKKENPMEVSTSVPLCPSLSLSVSLCASLVSLVCLTLSVCVFRWS
jgi:hypothetical protein